MPFFQILSDGFAILSQYKEALLVFFLTTFGLGLFVARILKLEKFLSGIGLLACFGLGSLLLVVESYLYTGGGAFSFPSAELARQTWLQPVFRAQQVQFYQVTGCNQP